MAIANPENYLTQASADARYQALGSLGSATPAQVDAGDTGTAGVSSSAARQDHEHPVAITSAQLVPAAWLAGWTSYTPTLTQGGAVTKTVTYAKYIQMGKTVIVNILLAATGAGTANNDVTVSLPVTAAFSSGFAAAGTFTVVDSGVAVYNGVAYLNSTTTAAGLANGDSLYLGRTGADFAAALASGDQIAVSLTYEAA